VLETIGKQPDESLRFSAAEIVEQVIRLVELEK